MFPYGGSRNSKDFLYVAMGGEDILKGTVPKRPPAQGESKGNPPLGGSGC